MAIPEILEPYQSKAKKLIEKGCVKEIEFSGGTYQVQVVDGGHECWAFVQLDDRGQVKDSFCSCEEGEEEIPCIHLAAAYLRIFNHSKLPLHKRFERSLWNQLCHLYADRVGYDGSILKQVARNQYALNSVGKKQIFYVKTKSPEAKSHLRDILFHRHKETEETSLKFSNLSPEEIVLWREGRPSSQLSYELSFWNDLAKWMMIMQESGEPYTIDFEYSSKELPSQIRVQFPNLEVGFYLSEANLPKIIPSLATVDSPLKLHNAEQEAIKKIVYDKKGCLSIEMKEDFIPKSTKKANGTNLGIRVDGWVYVPDDGFYAVDQRGLLATPKLCGEQVNHALNEHLPLVESFLEGTKIHHHPIQLSYHLNFDDEWNLHILGYLFNPGDLTDKGSHVFGEWVYLKDDGFYRVEDKRFDKIDTIIPSTEIPNFIQQNRPWLNNQEGFQTHISSIESQLAFTLNENDQLSFSRKLAVSADAKDSKDFGPWIYVPNQGFYSKASAPIGLPLRPDVSLKADQIPLFIRMNAEELKLVPGFFSEKCPVTKSGVSIQLLDENHIQITPEYELLPEYQNKPIKFFDDFAYVPGEGFHELPVDSRLPERIRHPSIIEGNHNITLFLSYELEGLKHYASQIDPRLIRPQEIQLTATSITEAEETGKGWYALKLSYKTENGMIPITAMWATLKQKRRYVFSDFGMLDLEEKRFTWLKLLKKNRIDRRSNTLILSTLELIRLNAFESINVQKARGTNYEHSLELLHELTEFRIPEPPNVTGLKSSLRPYQEIGLNWLWFLYHHSLSGLLCDDMGLGKTHQSMALMESIVNYHKQNKHARRQFLIICPTSVLFHWQEKLATFLPELRVCIHYGLNRSLQDFSQFDVLLTSYGVWRMEHETLSKMPFELAIFDEIQIAKNHNSRIHASLLRVNATMKLGLTGTPIENHLRELKALFDIVLPTYMPNETEFRDFFVRPIEKERDASRRELLSRFIKPFVLRRKKDEVLTDLPEKIEEISHCGLSNEQVLLYDNVLRKSRESVIRELQDSTNPIPFIHVFSILSGLKQICNHPAAYLKSPHDYKSHHSGKWDLFVELLNEARESQQKVVVFSQYLAMLDIIEEYLNEHGISYATIRGSTTDRGDQVRRFNTDPNCEVFVGSLQASGLGVDLTAGSVVIHYDRWWNAARENQATDRVHRIGQTRGVQVFKLVTKGTFEEKIDQMISRKGQLMEDVVTSDDHQLLKSLDRNELIELLQFVETAKDVTIENSEE